MALLKFLRRDGATPDHAAAPTAGLQSAAVEAVQAARAQARRRLIGAVILLGVGIIGFPIVFQTQPRPIPVDIPIDIPKRDAVPPLTMAEPPAGAAAAGAGPAAAPPTAPAARSAGPEAGAEAARAAQAAVEVEVLPAARPAAAPASAAGPAAEAGKPPETAAKASDKASDKASSDKDRGRFIVQAGSLTDAEAVRELRARLERMGLKTYTQAAVIDGVQRVRVRVGPFATRQEALDVQNKIKAAGITAVLLQL